MIFLAGISKPKFLNLDEYLRIKLKEAINCVDKFCLNESKQTDDNSVVQLLRYYELDRELSKV